MSAAIETGRTNLVRPVEVVTRRGRHLGFVEGNPREATRTAARPTRADATTCSGTWSGSGRSFGRTIRPRRK